MKELLNSLSEMLDKKEVKSININYSRVGDTESLSATVNKENNNDITVNIDTLNTNSNIEGIAKELATMSKKVSLY